MYDNQDMYIVRSQPPVLLSLFLGLRQKHDLKPLKLKEGKGFGTCFPTTESMLDLFHYNFVLLRLERPTRRPVTTNSGLAREFPQQTVNSCFGIVICQDMMI